MAKYHLNPATGRIGPCDASVRKCPLGGESGEENHYETLDEAEAAQQEQLKEEYGFFSTSKKKSDAVQYPVEFNETDKAIYAKKGYDKDFLNSEAARQFIPWVLYGVKPTRKQHMRLDATVSAALADYFNGEINEVEAIDRVSEANAARIPAKS